MTIEFGLLLPHFSDSTTWDRLFGFAPRAEELGYESLWARDNLSFHGHGFELPGDHFVDPFTTLAGVAARTERAKIGTAVLTPFRHPLITAQLVGGLDYLSQALGGARSAARGARRCHQGDRRGPAPRVIRRGRLVRG